MQFYAIVACFRAFWPILDIFGIFQLAFCPLYIFSSWRSPKRKYFKMFFFAQLKYFCEILCHIGTFRAFWPNLDCFETFQLAFFPLYIFSSWRSPKIKYYEIGFFAQLNSFCAILCHIGPFYEILAVF